MAKKFRYALIGSRKAPEDIFNLLVKIAYYRAKRGCFLGSSGAADCSDTALEIGVWTYLLERKRLNSGRKYMRVYLPSRKFNGRYACKENGFIFVRDCQAAIQHASRFHPNWRALDPFDRQLMARNSYQILGKNLNRPVGDVICWTPDGSLGDITTPDTGGTGQALRIAHANKVPVYNLKIPSHRKFMETIVRDVRLPFELTRNQLNQFQGYTR